MPSPPRTDTDDHRPAEPVPPGWPGDDPTVRDEEGVLGGRPRRAPVDTGAADVLTTDDRALGHADRGRRREDDPHLDTGDGDGHDGALDGDPDLDDLAAGVQPAGRVLVIMVVALVLAMLVNADALVERAEGRPPGPPRDRALAVLHPVQDVSHALQLHRIRLLADWATGDDDSEPAAPPGRGSRDRGAGPGQGGGTAADGDAPGTGDPDDTGPPADGELRQPTSGDPLRVYVAGDFMAQTFGESLIGSSEATGLVEAALHFESASGLTRSDYYDWPAALERDVDEHDAEVVVVMFGANDGQGITLADGSPVPDLADPRWGPEYRRRVGAVMDQLRAPGRMVVWVGQPPMRSPDFAAAMRTLNQAYVDEAASRPWVTFVDAAAVLGGEGGAYAENAPAPGGGDPVVIRQPDGIHLTAEGADLLAARVMALLGAEVDLGG